MSKKMTIQECKDQVAQNRSLDGWFTIERMFEKNKLNVDELNGLINEAMQIYASQLTSLKGEYTGDKIEKMAQEYVDKARGVKDVPYVNGLFYGFKAGFEKAISLGSQISEDTQAVKNAIITLFELMDAGSIESFTDFKKYDASKKTLIEYSKS